MKYQTLDGVIADGDVVSAGPLYQSVWIMRPDRTFTVGKISGMALIEVEYQPPQHIPPVPQEIQQLAHEIVDRYRESCRMFALLGATPHHADHDWAVGILARADAARRSRLPFLASRATTASVGEKRLAELQTVAADIDGEQSEMIATRYAKYLKTRAKQKD